jgi:hypothetical protein
MNEKLEKKMLKDQQKLEALRQANRNKFVSLALATSEGRDYFYWLMSLCRVGQNVFSTDALAMAFRSGEVNVGQQVQAHIIEASPQAYLNMLVERQEEEKYGRAIDGDTDSNGDSDGTEA